MSMDIFACTGNNDEVSITRLIETTKPPSGFEGYQILL